MKRITRHLSYANIMATVAVVFAMAGGAIAATGGFTSGGKLQACVNEEGRVKLLKSGERCKRGTKSVSWSQSGPAGAKGAPGVPGASGAAGVAGAQGAVGAKGADGLSGTANIVVRSKPEVGAFNDEVQCEPGEKATGGGAGRQSQGASGQDGVTLSAPVDENGDVPAEGETPTGWRVGGTFVQNANIYVICASA